MEKPSFLTPEQFEELKALLPLGAKPADGKRGLGSPGMPFGQQAGLGCDAGPGYGVHDFLALGYPRLALARADRCPFVAKGFSIRTDIVSPTESIAPAVGSKEPAIEDTIIDSIQCVIQPQIVQIGSFDPLRIVFFQYTSGLEATLTVKGKPGYDPFVDFTPLVTMINMINSGQVWPKGWVITYNEQFQMAFRPKVTLPADLLPIEIIVTFRAWVPVSDKYVKMSGKQAIQELADNYGIQAAGYPGAGCV